MPRGSRHDETGRLREERGQFTLDRDAGGSWRLDVQRGAKQLVGRRVRVVGTRAEFDLLDVTAIEAI